MGNSCSSCLAAPFVAIWRLTVGIVRLLGRALTALIGLLMMIAGIVLSLTVVGAVVGIPLILMGLMLMVRSIF